MKKQRKSTQTTSLLLVGVLALTAAAGILNMTPGNTDSPTVTGSYLNTSEQTVALVDNYYPSLQMTQYSGLTVNSITVYANAAGDLEIGTAPIGADGDIDTELYPVDEGRNTITFENPLTVAEDATIVLGGGNTTVDLRTTSSENSDFGDIASLSDGALDPEFDLLETRLRVGMDVVYYDTASRAVFETIESDLGSLTSLSAANNASAPFVYRDLTLFENSHVTGVSVPLLTVSDYTADSVFTVYVLGLSSSISDIEVVSTHELVIPANTFSSNTVNQWYYFDVDITLENNQTLGFLATTDTVTIASAKLGLTQYQVYNKVLSSPTEIVTNLFFSVYKDDQVECTLSDYLQILNERNAKAALAGLNFSVLGDSISTFEGWSNDTTANSTIGSNVARYPEQDVLSVEYTWWGKSSIDMGMNLLVTNTWRSTRVSTTNGTAGAGCLTRCVNLHDDVGDNAGTMPDVIAVYMGINDIDHQVTLGSFSGLSDVYADGEYVGDLTAFAPAYATMLHKISVAYPDAEVFVFTHTINHYVDTLGSSWFEKCNAAIEDIAEYFGAHVVDLYNDSGITANNYTTYTHDGLHPYAAGMTLIAECFESVLIDVYKNR